MGRTCKDLSVAFVTLIVRTTQTFSPNQVHGLAHILRNRFQAAVHHMEKATHVGVFCPSHPEPPRLTRRLITQGITGVSWAGKNRG